jgi:hypothetical protein
MQRLGNQTVYFETREQPLSWALGAGQWLIVVLLLAVSPLTLFMFGWQYFDTGGSPIEKFHPATLLAGALVLLMATQIGNPITGLIALCERHSRLLPYVIANVFMIVYAAQVLKLPVTIFIETFLGAAFVYLVFFEIDDAWAVRLARTTHLLLFVNSLLAMYEIANGFHLTPLVINGELLDEPRATALLGHPLANAALVGLYVVLLACGGGRDLPAWMQPICFLSAFGSLFAFGGRAATAGVVVSLAYLGTQTVLPGLGRCTV